MSEFEYFWRYLQWFFTLNPNHHPLPIKIDRLIEQKKREAEEILEMSKIMAEKTRSTVH